MSVRTLRTIGIASSIAFISLALLGPGVTARADWTFERGDCNADSAVDIGDAVFTLSALFSGGPSGPCDDACDANDDGGRDIGDAIYTLNFLFIGGPASPAPTGVCGEDPTTDGLACAGPIAGCPDGTPPVPLLEPARPPLAMPGNGVRINRPKDVTLASKPPRPPFGSTSHRQVKYGERPQFIYKTLPKPWEGLFPRPPRRDLSRAGLGAGGEPGENTIRDAGFFLDDVKVTARRGEVTADEVDVVLPGIGIDFVFARRYRSQDTGESGTMGHQWEHCYEIRAELTPSGILLRDGDHRVDLLVLQPDGSHSKSGVRLRVTPIDAVDPNLTVDFGNGGTWTLEPVPGSTTDFRISLSTDVHGNHLAFSYDGAGRLSTIIDTVGRTIGFGYDSAGRLTSLSDGTGRTWTYAYYGPGEAGGGPGDLKSVTTPPIVGTPTGNDFPAGRTTTYAYTSGHADDDLNHNLVSVIDARGHTRFVNVYDEAPASPWKDTLVSHSADGATWQLVLHPEVPSASNGGAVVRAIVNDDRGAVTEGFYDALHRRVKLREWNGFADPSQPTTATTNRPGPPRPGNPLYEDTDFTWNPLHDAERIVHPNGNETLYTYEGDIDPTASFLRRTNLVQVRRIPGTHVPPGPFAELVESFQVQQGFGGWCESDFRTQHVDARGGVTVTVRDSFGNATQVQHPVAALVEDFEYDAQGRPTAHVRPDNAPLGMPPARRRDEFTYHAAGPGVGQPASVVVDANGFELTTAYAYDLHGDLAGVVHPWGVDEIWVRNALGEPVHHLTPAFDSNGTRYLTRCFHDANGNLVRVDEERRDADGALDPVNPWLTRVVEYDALDRPVRELSERGSADVPLGALDGSGLPASEFVVSECQYDAAGRLIHERSPEAVSGAQQDAVVAYEYDERGFVRRRVRGPGGPSSSTDEVDYDGNGNVIQVSTGLESGVRVTGYLVDGHDNPISMTDAMGNVQTFEHDQNGNVVNWRLDGELADVPGSAGNVRLEEVDWTYDALDRPIGEVRHRFDPATQLPLGGGDRTTTATYRTTVEVVFDDAGDETRFSYDSAERLTRITDPMGNQVEYSFDTSSTVQTELHRDQTGVPGQFVERTITYGYDGLRRMTSAVGPLGELRTWAHASDGVGREVDELGNVTRWQRDGIGHTIVVARDLTADGTGATPVVATATEAYEVDGNGRLTASTDPNGNETQYAYDALDRLVQVTYADGTTETQTFDAHDDLDVAVDANGSLFDFTWNTLSDLGAVSILAAPGVDPSATFASYAYDGRGLLVSAANDDGALSRSYDSLGVPQLESADGLTTIGTSDDEGHTTQITYPSGRQLSYAYDALGRVTQVSEGGVALAAYQYLGPSRVRERTASDGSTTVVLYDASGRPSEIEVTNPALSAPTVSRHTFAWNALADLGSITDEVALRTTSWTRDSFARLVASTRTGGGLPPVPATYLLDVAGNRTAVTGLPCSGSYVMDPTFPAPADAQMNQYTQTPCDARTYSAGGELVSVSSTNPAIPPTLLSYDALGQLRSHQVLGQPATTYEYDALGRKTKTISTSSSNRAILCCFPVFADRVIAEHDGNGVEVSSYAYGAGELVSMRSTGTSGIPEDYVYHLDATGSVVALTAAVSGSPVESYEYGDHGQVTVKDAFGNTLPGSQVGSPFYATWTRFYPAGESPSRPAPGPARLDPSGLYHVAGSEWFEPGTGRSIRSESRQFTLRIRDIAPAAAAGSRVPIRFALVDPEADAAEISPQFRGSRNFLVADPGRPMISDFGMSRLARKALKGTAVVQGNGALTAGGRSGNVVIRFELEDSTGDSCRIVSEGRDGYDGHFVLQRDGVGIALRTAFPGPMAPPMPNIPVPLIGARSGYIGASCIGRDVTVTRVADAVAVDGHPWRQLGRTKYEDIRITGRSGVVTAQPASRIWVVLQR